jgi:predicted S18 family serine protease
LALALGFSSLLTGIPLRQGMTASGIIDDNGNITPVGSLARKIMAAKEAGLTTFLLSIDQKLEAGEQVIPVMVYRLSL